MCRQCVRESWLEISSLHVARTHKRAHQEQPTVNLLLLYPLMQLQACNRSHVLPAKPMSQILLQPPR